MKRKKKKFDPYSFDEAYKSAIRLLKYRFRSEKEMRERLKQKRFESSVIEKVIEKLKEQNYINDERFAYFYAYDQLTLMNKGPYEIKRALKNFGVDDYVIEDIIRKVLEEVDVREVIRNLINKLRGLGREDRYIKEYLFRRGFDTYDIDEVMNNTGGE